MIIMDGYAEIKQFEWRLRLNVWCLCLPFGCPSSSSRLSFLFGKENQDRLGKGAWRRRRRWILKRDETENRESPLESPIDFHIVKQSEVESLSHFNVGFFLVVVAVAVFHGLFVLCILSFGCVCRTEIFV